MEKRAAIELVVKKFIEKDQLRMAVETAKLGVSEEIANLLISECREKGSIGDAVDATKIAGRKLSVDEIDGFVMRFIGNNWIGAAVEAAKQGASEFIIRILISKCIEQGERFYAINAAELLNRKLTTLEIDQLLQKNIDNGQLSTAYEVAQLGASREKLISFRDKCIEMNNTFWSVRAATLAGSSIAPQDVHKLVIKCIEDDHLNEAVGIIESQGAFLETVVLLVQRCIKKGKAISSVFEIAQKRGLNFREQDIDNIVKTCLKRNDLSDAVDMAKLGASKKMIKILIDECITQKRIKSSVDLAELL